MRWRLLTRVVWPLSECVARRAHASSPSARSLTSWSTLTQSPTSTGKLHTLHSPIIIVNPRCSCLLNIHFHLSLIVAGQHALEGQGAMPVPWGTPLLASDYLDPVIELITPCRIPMLRSLRSKISWSTLSNALLEATNSLILAKTSPMLGEYYTWGLCSPPW